MCVCARVCVPIKQYNLLVKTTEHHIFVYTCKSKETSTTYIDMLQLVIYI